MDRLPALCLQRQGWRRPVFPHVLPQGAGFGRAVPSHRPAIQSFQNRADPVVVSSAIASIEQRGEALDAVVQPLLPKTRRQATD